MPDRRGRPSIWAMVCTHMPKRAAATACPSPARVRARFAAAPPLSLMAGRACAGMPLPSPSTNCCYLALRSSGKSTNLFTSLAVIPPFKLLCLFLWGSVAALLIGPDGAFITGSDFLMADGVTAAYWHGDLDADAR
jgi:hypothetical protein